MRRNIVTWDRSSGRRSFQLNVNEPGQFTESSILFKEYDAFISHKGDDTGLAEQVGDVLYQQDVSAYLDKWDPKVDGDSPDLEIHIREVIRETPCILVVVTEHTPLSWWVPFELGVARETGSQIATFLRVNEEDTQTVYLPSYLKNWPIMASQQELTAWARELARTKSAPIRGRTILLEKAVQMSDDSRGLGRIVGLVSSGKVRFVG